MPNHQFSDSFFVFTHEKHREKTREIAERHAMHDAAKEHRGYSKSALRKTETYEDRLNFYRLHEKIWALALEELKWDAWLFVGAGIYDGEDAVRIIDEAAKNGFDIVGKPVINGKAKEGIANLDAKDNDGKTLLHHAAECGLLSVAKTLKRHGADIDARDNNQQTPLRLAVEKGVRVDLVQYLIDAGADVNIQDKRGQTLLAIAEALFEDAPDDEKKRREKIKVEIKKAIVNRSPSRGL